MVRKEYVLVESGLLVLWTYSKELVISYGEMCSRKLRMKRQHPAAEPESTIFGGDPELLDVMLCVSEINVEEIFSTTVVATLDIVQSPLLLRKISLESADYSFSEGDPGNPIHLLVDGKFGTQELIKSAVV